tara:strand:+ start:257 stop:742 length:486 start_codon:yes stop_codon:yes gene_type:complete
MKFAPEHKVAYLKALVTWACIACWIPLSFYVHENLFNVFVFISYALFLMCGLAVFLWIAALVVEVGKPEHKDASGDWKRKVTDKSLVDTFATPLFNKSGIDKVHSEREQIGLDRVATYAITITMIIMGHFWLATMWLSTLILRSCKGEALTKFDSVFVEEI